ncbi:MAG: orotidine-5'-phosphate decarboxylase [Actinomycetota bacterium]
MTGLIVALDDPHIDRAEELAGHLAGSVSAFKVGLTLFTVAGPDAVRRIGRFGPVFCDLKLHDIPHQVGLAAEQLAKLGAWMFTVHASGGAAMMRAAVDAAGKSESSPTVSAVTVLTSLSRTDMADLGIDRSPAEQVGRLARLATQAGVGALVCSAQETELLRKQLGDEVVLVTPGIRPAGSAEGDQVRVVTPARAVEAGASYVVVGRPVTDADDPAAAAASIAEALAT